MPPAHYLKIPSTLRDWFPGGAPPNWIQVIFSDSSEDGTRLVLEPLPSNALGERVAIHGDRFYYEAGRDRERFDTLFLTRIEPADRRLPRQTPKSYPCRLVLWTGGDPAILNPIGPVFGAKAIVEGPASEESRAPLAEEPSPLLLALVQKAPDSVRVLFRPGAAPKEPTEAREFLAPFQAFARRFGIAAHTAPSPRQERLLLGLLNPPELGRKERDGILRLFGFGLLNGMLGKGIKPEEFYELLRQLGSMPGPSGVRPAIWSAAIRGLQPDTLRKELHACAAALHSFVTGGIDAEGAWEDGLLAALREVVRRENDGGLRELVASAESADDPLATVASWASRLQFSESETSSAVAEPQRPQSLNETVPPVGSAPVTTPTNEADPVEAWMVRASVPDLKQLFDVAAKVLGCADSLRGLNQSAVTTSAVRNALQMMEDLSSVLSIDRVGLPSLASLDASLLDSASLLEELRALLGETLDDLVADETMNPSALVELRDLLRQSEALRTLPSWILTGELGEASVVSDTSLNYIAGRLKNIECRRLVRNYLGYLEQLDEPRTVRWLRAPDADQDPEEHVRAWFDGARDLLANLSPEDREVLLSADGVANDPEQLRHDQSTLRWLGEQLSPETFTEVEKEIETTKIGRERTGLISRYKEAVDFFEKAFGDAATATYPALRNRVLKQREPVEEVVAAFPLLVDHNWVESTGTRATLVFVQPDPSVAWGYVDAPVVIETDRPKDYQVRLEFDLKGDHRRAWPTEWPAIEPAGAFRLPTYAWRKDLDRKVYQISRVVRIYFRKPADESPRLELAIKAVDPVSGAQLSLEKVFLWESISTKPISVSLEWLGTTNPSYVTEHPIGPQLNVESLLNRLNRGSSVAVIAPRRFGKSTLVEYLHRELSSSGCVVPEAQVCTLLMGPGGLDLSGLWTSVSDGLQELLDVGLPRSAASGPIPPVRAFDAVRRAAKSKGHKAVVILIDEAQLLFSGIFGKQIGTQLKDALERDWSRTDQEGMAPLCVALIGLPSLRERAGVDLMGLLMPIERSEMKEDELRPLVGAMTKNLQTTKAARVKLCDSAGNLFILRVLLERLTERVQREGRCWCNYDDVKTVQEALEEELRTGRDVTLAPYIRDALNDAELVTDWEPTPSFPVAAALAPACHVGQAFDEAVVAATAQLNDWGRLSQGDEKQIVTPTYDLELVRKHVASLEERRVIRQGQFSGELLQAWLVGVNRIGTFDEAFQTALFRGSQRRIRIPSGGNLVGEGLEARVYRIDQLAYRVRAVATEQDRLLFLESCRMLEGLRGGHVTRESGSDYIFELREIGLSATNSNEAVQVYHWVPGEDLSQKVGALNEELVIDIGVKLARGVALLHRNGILHRDIRPPNVIANLDDGGTLGIRPVLIDFGFARTIGSDMRTRLAGEYCAPEVCEPIPRWTKAADVYSLASTLRSLLPAPKQGAQSELRAFLTTAISAEPANRPLVTELLEGLEDLSVRQQVEQTRQDLWADLQRRVAKDRHKGWFTRILNKHRMKFEAMAMGFHASPVDRYRLIAMFLEQLTESFPPNGLRMRTLIDESSEGESIRYLAALRVLEAHSGNSLTQDQQEVWRRFERLGPEGQRSSVAMGIERLAASMGLESLPALLSPYL